MDRPRSTGRLLSQRPADQAAVRRSNLALVLGHLRDAGPRSRARIAAETGLNKATVSSLVSELVDRRLAREGEIQRAGSVGRPAQAVELDGSGVCGIGLEINVDYVAALALDLSHDVVFDRRVAIDAPALDPAEVLDATAELARAALREVGAAGVAPVGITIAMSGLVESRTGTLVFAPNLHWRDVRVSDEIDRRLGRPGIPVTIDNDANLSAIGEYAMGGVAGTPDLVYLTGEVGVGGGVIVGGRLLRGAAGFSGEVGHMPLDPDGHLCGCGQRGCWETMVGLAGLLRLATDPSDPVCDPSLDLERRLTVIHERAEAGDERTLKALRRIGTGLGFGAVILVNVFNPQVIVLGGYFARFGPYLLEPMLGELTSRVIAPAAGGCRLELSTLGFTAATRGGAHVALESVFEDPTVVAGGDSPRVGNAAGATVRGGAR
jgi:predicted NBD/HSP70 family sugar kinase